MQETSEQAGPVEWLFGQRVRAARQEREWSQRELAERVSNLVKLDPTAITRIEKGERNVRLDEAVALADALDLSLDVAAHWTPDSGLGQFSQYEHMSRLAMLRARRELVRLIRYVDRAMAGLFGEDDDQAVLTAYGVDSFSELWERFASQMEPVWKAHDPVVGSMWCVTYDDEDELLKRRLLAAVTHGLFVSEDEISDRREVVDDGERQEEG